MATCDEPWWKFGEGGERLGIQGWEIRRLKVEASKKPESWNIIPAPNILNPCSDFLWFTPELGRLGVVEIL